jgi:OmpR family response regulator RpaB
MGIYNEKLLVIDKEIEIRKLLEMRLSSLGYDVILRSNTQNLLSFIIKEHFDLIIVDLILPTLDGYEICRKIREDSGVPVILLSALGNVKNRVMGLDSGADDYIIKPFSPKELESRIRSVLRRFNSNNSTSSKKNKIVLKTNNLVINLNTRQVSKNGLVIKLTNIECNILELLINNHGKKLSRSMILNNVWGYIPQRIVDTRIVDVHIARLRSKIEEDAANPDLIITERGVGYVFLSLDR